MEGGGGTERLGAAMLLAQKMKEGITNQGMQGTSRSWEKLGNGFSAQASRKNAALPTY